MKISGCIIQERNIQVNTQHCFVAKYKNHWINISDNYGLGEPQYDHLTRFNIEVIYDDGEVGGMVVDTWEDCHTIRDAIRIALKGACLLK